MTNDYIQVTDQSLTLDGLKSRTNNYRPPNLMGKGKDGSKSTTSSKRASHLKDILNIRVSPTSGGTPDMFKQQKKKENPSAISPKDENYR